MKKQLNISTKKSQFFIIQGLGGTIKEFAAPSFKTRASEIKEKYNYKFPGLQNSAA